MGDSDNVNGLVGQVNWPNGSAIENQAHEVALEIPKEVKKAANAVLNYLFLTGEELIPGCTFGSPKMLIITPYQLIVAREIRRAYRELYRRKLSNDFPSMTPDLLCYAYSCCRAYGFEDHSAGELLKTSTGQKGLFSDGDADDASAALYAVKLQYDDRKGIIKLGYTTKKVDPYIATTYRGMNPIKLATRRGTKSQEQRLHHKFRAYRVIRDEYYKPHERIFTHLKDSWCCVENFGALTIEAHNEFNGVFGN